MVSVADDKLHVLDALLVHVLHGIGATAANPNHLDDGLVLGGNVKLVIHRNSFNIYQLTFNIFSKDGFI
jgi:hypothetical protein